MEGNVEGGHYIYLPRILAIKYMKPVPFILIKK